MITTTKKEGGFFRFIFVFLFFSSRILRHGNPRDVEFPHLTPPNPTPRLPLAARHGQASRRNQGVMTKKGKLNFTSVQGGDDLSMMIG